MSKIAIIGTTSWGTTLGIVLGKKGCAVALWARTAEEAAALSAAGENAAFLPGFPFPGGLTVTSFAGEAITGADMVILAAPAQTLRGNIRVIRDHLGSLTLVLSVAKGLEKGTLLRMSEVIAQEIPAGLHRNICVLSGPNLSLEIVRGLPAATVVAACDEGVLTRAQELLSCPNLRVYTNHDVVGVELGGALKNIIALGAGIADGMGIGDNAKAMYITRGLAEIARLGGAAGANPLTFAGLAGLGDLIVTCSSELSRNHQAGLKLARGLSLEEVTSSVRTVAEGIPTTQAAYQLARKLGVEMPITTMMYRILFEGLSPREALTELMRRAAGEEFQGLSLECQPYQKPNIKMQNDTM
ncbi:MAG: NAD(P)-dependent glycerol-3-phosphate dehydrogenase [Chloroflexi bacterium]|nr:NAD(P)-dependent glycerol-3-phosphate dehydrogenase [Chloroflexota bacterium]